MIEQKFRQIIQQELTVSQSLKKIAFDLDNSATMDFGISEAILLSTLLPLTSYVIREIGLPWLHEVKRYSELWRLKFDTWIDQQYKDNNIDKEQARLAGDKLRAELEATTDPQLQASWQRVTQLLTEAENED